jgi:uncharacterized membrane protein YdbT with pleckstrin-like domain
MTDGYLTSLLSSNEKVMRIARQHWTVLAGEILSESVLTLALIVGISVIWAQNWIGSSAAFGFLLLIFPLVSLGRDVLDWLNRQYVITNRRVIQIAGIVNKDVTDSSLEKVNDVKMEQSVLGRLLGYGDIAILTASELGINKFKRLSDPIHFKTAMLNAKAELELGSARAGRAASDMTIPDLIAQLDTLRQRGVLSAEEFQKKKAELMAKL